LVVSSDADEDLQSEAAEFLDSGRGDPDGTEINDFPDDFYAADLEYTMGGLTDDSNAMIADSQPVSLSQLNQETYVVPVDSPTTFVESFNIPGPSNLQLSSRQPEFTRATPSPRFSPYQRPSPSHSSLPTLLNSHYATGSFAPSPISPITPLTHSPNNTPPFQGSPSITPPPPFAGAQPSPRPSTRGRGNSAPPLGPHRTASQRARGQVGDLDAIYTTNMELMTRKKEREHERFLKEANIKTAKYQFENNKILYSPAAIEHEHQKLTMLLEKQRAEQEHQERMLQLRLRFEESKLKLAQSIPAAQPPP